MVGVYSDSRATELPRAYVVAQDGVATSQTNAQEIRDWVDKQVANHKRLRGGIQFIDNIPTSAAGKILRRELRSLASQQQAGRAVKL